MSISVLNTSAALSGKTLETLEDAQTVTAAKTFSSATPIILSNASGGVRERNRAFQMGEWQSQAYNAADFVAVGGGTWTVDAADVKANKYTVIGKTLFWNLKLSSTTIAGTANSLTITVPGGFSTPSFTTAPMQVGWILENGSGTPFIPANIQTGSGGTTISVFRIAAVPGASSAFTVTTNLLDISFTITLEIL